MSWVSRPFSRWEMKAPQSEIIYQTQEPGFAPLSAFPTSPSLVPPAILLQGPEGNKSLVLVKVLQRSRTKRRQMGRCEIYYRNGSWNYGGCKVLGFFSFLLFLHLLTCVYIVWATSPSCHPLPPPASGQSLFHTLLKRKHKR
jgi:hypothetical protein